MAPQDQHGRPLRKLRISVTDRCNLRCAYCMPEENYTWLPRREILDFEEIRRLAGVFRSLGIDAIRLTGGEPLLRRDLPRLVAMLASLEGIRDLALTTNGLRLAEAAPDLAAAGLHRVTVSLDTLQPERFRRLARREGLDRVLAGLEAAAAAGLRPLKINTVVLRDENDDEIPALLDLAGRLGAELRFIEYMDVGGASGWSAATVVPREEILERVAAARGRPEPLPRRDSAPAERFRLPDGCVFGIVASTTAPFCASCDRSRLTADGRWFLCLYAGAGLDLRSPLRGGASDAALRRLVTDTWQLRRDRGAEERLGLRERQALPRDPAVPHREMRTKGG